MGLFTRCFILLFCISGYAGAEQIFSRFGVDDGLPNATIYSIVQDDTGFLWLGSTNSGLLRFDGYRFTEFAVLTQQELQQQQTADVGVIMLDDKNNIWAGTWGFGVSVIEAGTGKLTRYTAEKLAGEQIQVLFQDSKRYIWVGSTEGLNRINPIGEVETIGETGLRIWSLAESDDGTIWIGTSTGLFFWRQDTGFSQLIQLKPGADRLSRENEIRALKVVNGKLWVGTRFGLYRYVIEQKQFVSVALVAPEQPQPIINIITTDNSNSTLMIGSYSGLYRLALSNTDTVPAMQPVMLSNVNVRSILLDRSNVLWLGSRESGLYRSIVSSKAFDDVNSLHPSLDIRQPFSITAVYQRQQQLWLGNTDSLHLINLATSQHQIIPTASRVNAIKSTSDGSVYIATDSGLLRYNGTAELQKVDEPFVLSGVVNRNVRDLAVDQHDRLYLGMWGEGVIGWQPDSATTQRWLTQLAQHATGNTVQSVFVGANDQLWVGTRYSGLFQIDLVSGNVKRHSSLGDTELKLPHNDVQCVSEYGAELAVCSREGLLLFNRQSGTLQQFTTEQGLPANTVLAVLQQQQGRLWVSTAKGLGFRPAAKHHFISYNSNDGMLSSELNANAIFAGKEQVFLGAIAGLVVVSPSQLNVNARTPQPVLSALTIDQLPTEVKPHQQSWPDIRLEAGQRSLALEFSALDYQDPERNRFQYQLEGIDARWISSPNQNKAFYANLPAGRYTLWLKASNNHGFFSDQVKAASITVLPHWWQQSWVIYSGISTFIVLLWLMHLYRLRHIRQINRLLQETVEHKAKAQLVLETRVAERTRALEESSVTLSLRTRQLERSLEELANRNTELKRVDKLKDEFIATVSHELRTPLTAIRGAIGLIAQNVVPANSESYQNLLQTAQANSERLAHLINDLLDLQKFTTGTFSLQMGRTNLVALAQQSVSAMQPYAQRFEVELLLSNDVNEAWATADATRIRQVMDNLISNAIKFSTANNKVVVRFICSEATVGFEVEDFGSGIPDEFKPRIFDKFSQADGSDSRAKEGTGLGLAICKKIIENHQGQIGFRSVLGAGSTFWFTLEHDDAR